MRLPIAILFLAACTGDDAGDAVDARPADARPGPVDGTWKLTWRCMPPCTQDPLPVYALPFLIAEGITIAFARDPAAAPVTAEQGRVEQGCVHVDATVGPLHHEAYDVCPYQPPFGIVTRMNWSGATWDVQGVRQ